MASIRYLKHRKLWQVVWSVRGPAGRRQPSKTFATKREATRFRAKVEVEVESRGIGDPTKQTVRTLFDSYLEYRAGLNLSPSTLVSERRSLGLMANVIGSKVLAKTTGQDIALAVPKLHSEGGKSRKKPADGRMREKAPLAAQSVKNILTTTRAAFAMAVTPWKLIGSNPCDGIKPPKVERRNVRALSDDEVNCLLAAAVKAESKGRLHAGIDLMVALLFACGMRRGELCALAWDAVDLKNGTLTVRRNAVTGPNKIVHVRETAKSAAGVRTISVPAALVERLRLHKVRVAEHRLACGAEWASGLPFVFPLFGGGILPPNRLTGRMRLLMQRAKIPPGSFQPCHGLRHTSATMLLTAGVDPMSVAKRIGHRNPMTTMLLYGHMVEKVDRAAGDLLGERLAALTKAGVIPR